jgi:hypothetical protein
MATSPLTTALKPNVSAGDDAEQKYQQALTELMQRLDTRKNRLFDPVLLAMAQGFANPGQTGSFGEALGNVAQKVGAAEAQRQKEDIDISQLRLQVAQGAREQASKIRGQEAFRGLLGGQQPAAQDAGESEEFTGATGTGLRTVAGDTGDVVAPRQAAGQPSAGGQRDITEQDALAFAAAYPDQKDLAKLLMDAAKSNSERYKISMNGTVFDTRSRKYIAEIPPGQTASGYFIPEARGTVLMTPSQHADYQKARSQGNSRQWLDSFYGGEPGKVEYVTQEMLAAEAERKKQAATDFLIPEVNDTLKMTAGQYDDYMKARRAGEGVKWVENFLGRPISGGAALPTAGALAARTEAPQDFLIPEVNGYLRMTPSENAQYREAKRQGKGQEWVTNFVGQQGGQAPTTQGLARREAEAQQTASQYLIPELGGTLLLTPKQYQEYKAAAAQNKGKEWADQFVRNTPSGPPPTQQNLEAQAAAARQTPAEFFIPEIGGKLSMRPAQFEEYQRARALGLANQWLQQNFSAQPAARPPGAAPGAPGAPRVPGAPGAAQGAAAPGGILTTAQLEADAAAKRAEAESVAKADAERYNTAIAKGNDAGSKIASYRSIAATARLPSAKQIFGVFEQGGVSDALLRYMEANNGVLGVKEIRDIWTGLGLDAKAISDKQVAMSLIAQSQFEFSQLAKGQGTISDQERKLFAAMGTDISDRPETVLRKMQMLERRAQFDREVSKMARDARKKGVSFDDMKDTDAYRTAQEAYMSDLMKAITGSGRNVSGARSQAPGAAPGAAPRAAQGSQGRNPAADRIRRDVGIAQ